jgi:hypothetical protein
MDTAERLPSVKIFQSDGEIVRMILDMPGNAPPERCSVLAEEVVVIGTHWHDHGLRSDQSQAGKT